MTTTMTKQSVEALLDLVEIKLSCMEVWDRDDKRELARLEQARAELLGLDGRGEGAEVVALPQRRRGRPRNAERQQRIAL
jgi:hypothetical protein